MLLNQNYGPYVGLGISIPIYNGGNSKRQQDIAALKTKTATLAKENQLMNYSTQASKVYQAYLNGLQQIEVARHPGARNWHACEVEAARNSDLILSGDAG